MLNASSISVIVMLLLQYQYIFNYLPTTQHQRINNLIICRVRRGKYLQISANTTVAEKLEKVDT